MRWISQQPAAQSYCQDELGTDLVSIHSQKEYDELIASVKSNHSAAMELWIGLNRLNTIDEQTWRWTDGSPWDWGTNVSGGVYPWISNGFDVNLDEPNNIGGVEKCVVTAATWSSANSYNWEDIQCSHTAHFLCAFGQTHDPTGKIICALCKDCYGESLNVYRAPNRASNYWTKCGAHTLSNTLSVEFIASIFDSYSNNNCTGRWRWRYHFNFEWNLSPFDIGSICIYCLVASAFCSASF